MSDKERLDIVEEKLAELLQKQELVDTKMQLLQQKLAEMEEKLTRVDARQQRWLTLLGLTLADADQVLDLWHYPSLLRQQADLRQN